jgi:thiol-disulfide isomerase/thioredoxin
MRLAGSVHRLFSRLRATHDDPATAPGGPGRSSPQLRPGIPGPPNRHRAGDRVSLSLVMKRVPPLLIAFLAGLAAVVIVIAIGTRNTDDEAGNDVVLDEPGEYQEPGIPTNAPLAGTDIVSATILDLDGDDVDLVSLLDGRPMLVNFWFSNCQPCKREMPALQDAWTIFGDRVRFIGVNTQDSESITRSFAEEMGVEYELLRDPDGRLVTANGVATFPTTLIVTADGTVVEQIAGEVTADDLTRMLDRVTGTNP